MTTRLYYDDPYLRSFEASIVAVERRAGAETAVVTDRTAFYPSSGGQPFDTGLLAGCRVVDVVDREDGSIEHVVRDDAGPGLEAGSSVRGEIDFARRFDHMQQHSGQHVLSAAFDRLLKVATVSFHLGAESSTIDLARAVSAAEIAKAEDRANAVVWEDRPVRIRYADAHEAAALKLRKPSAREGRLRLIDVEDFDLSACGGTHVSRTGGIGIIAVASSEKFKGGSRVEFLCGGRALARFRSIRDTVSATVRLLSVASGELPAAIEKMQADARDQKRSMTALQIDLARYRANEMAAEAERLGPIRLVARAVDGDATLLRSLASTIAERAGHMAVFASKARPSLVAIARASDVSADAHTLVTSLIARFGGRGGGRSELAQGGLDADPADIIAAVRVSIMAEMKTDS